MRNLLALIKAKERKLGFEEACKDLTDNGTLKRKRLEEIYTGSANVEELAKRADVLGLAESSALYAKDGRLIHLEIGMRNHMLGSGIRILRHSVLSFGAIIAYVYLKELEVSTIRVLLKGKQYGLGEDEMGELMAWRL